MSEKYFLHPEELLMELARSYPQPRVRRVPRPRVPSVTFSNENLYGVLIYIVGEGVRGQYLRHEYFYRELEKWWAIQIGWVTLYGRLKEQKGEIVLPLVLMGVPTRYVYQLSAEDIAEYLLEEIPIGYLEVKESQIINLDRCSQGRDPIMLIDKYGVMKQDGFSSPSELVEKIVEQQKLIEQLQRALWEYEKNVHEIEASRQMLQAENAKLRELIRDFKYRFQKLATEVSSVQMELIRLREDLKVRAREIEASERTETGLKNIIDGLEELMSDVQEHIRFIRETQQKMETIARGGEEKQ